MTGAGEFPVLLLEHAGVDWTIRVYSDEQRIRAVVVVEAHSDVPADTDQILEALRSAGFVLLPDLPDRLREAAQKGAWKQPIEIARGVPPQKGEPARPDWKIELAAKDETKVVDLGDRVDFRTQAHIVQVKEGDVLFETIPPTIGPPGVDVYGKEIPGLPGDPLPKSFIGENVRYDPETGVATAAVSGQVVVEASSVRLEPVFRIEGDVDFNVGNIEFNGEVVVAGNVLDGFSIKATRGITVHGSVFGATLESGGDIRIYEGATMQGRGKLRAAGRVQSKYLNHAVVEADGDVIVSSEIINSDVRAGGRLLIPRGNIYGGKVVALAGIEARQLGSPMIVPTQVCAGVDPETQKQIEQLDGTIREIEKKMERIIAMIRPYVEDPQQVLMLAPAMKERVAAQLKELIALRGQVGPLKEQRAQLNSREVPKDPRVMVMRRIYPKVTVMIGRCSTTYTQETSGPLNLAADEEKGRVVHRP